MKVIHNGELMADLPVDKLTDEAPLYSRPMAAPERSCESRSRIDPFDEKLDDTQILKTILKTLAEVAKYLFETFGLRTI